jgi:hypothetical protein
MMELFSGRTAEIAIAASAVIIVAVAGGLMTEVGDWYESLKFPKTAAAQLVVRARLDDNFRAYRRKRRRRLGTRGKSGDPVSADRAVRRQRRAQRSLEPALFQDAPT